MAMRVSTLLRALCVGLVAGVAALSATPSQAGIVVGDYIRFFDREGSTGGGEFGVAELPDANTELFRTFCLQFNEDQDFDPKGFKVVDISGHTEGLTSVPLDARTAYLYTQFTKGTLSGYDYTPGSSGHVASANALQLAIWSLQGEAGAPAATGQALTWIAEATNAVSGGAWSGLGDVRVLSLEWTDGHNKHFHEGDPAQDVLTMVPEPASIAVWSLLGVTFAVAGYRRRQRAKR